jgi:hypothetical protein
VVHLESDEGLYFIQRAASKGVMCERDTCGWKSSVGRFRIWVNGSRSSAGHRSNLSQTRTYPLPRSAECASHEGFGGRHVAIDVGSVEALSQQDRLGFVAEHEALLPQVWVGFHDQLKAHAVPRLRF